MKVLLSSNTPWGTSGYSTQAQLILRTLLTYGHEVAVYAWFGMIGQTLTINGVQVFPRLHHMDRDDYFSKFGGDADIVGRYWGADVVLTLQDIWPLPEEFAERLGAVPWIAYFPIDGWPIPPVTLERAKTAAYPVVYSKFAKMEMEAAGLDCDYIPHAIDTALFTPGDREAIRRQYRIPEDVFVVLMVAMNKGFPGRKSWPEALAAFQRFNRRHPESVLFLHTQRREKRGAGYKLDLLAQQLGIPQGAVKFVDQELFSIGLPSPFVAELYQMADVLLSPSMGEGFGLPIVEAQACGLPVITQACTSMGELTVNGIAVQPLQPFYTALDHWQYTANITEVDAALEWIYRWDDEQRAERAADGVRFVRQNYDLNLVAEKYWRPFLERVEAELGGIPAKQNGRPREAEKVPA